MNLLNLRTGLKGVALSLRRQVGTCEHCILQQSGRDLAISLFSGGMDLPASSSEAFLSILDALTQNGLGPFQVLEENWSIPMLTVLDLGQEPDLQDFVLGVLDGIIAELMHREGRQDLTLTSRRKANQYLVGSLQGVLHSKHHLISSEPVNCHVMRQNITLEHQLAGTSDQLREQERLLASILLSSTDAILSLDQHRIIRSWNHGAEQIYGYSAKEIVGKSIELLVPSELLANGELERIERILERQGNINHYETERLAKGGKRLTIDLTATLLRDSQGTPIGRSAIHRNITEKKRMERELLLSEKLSSIGKLAAHVAHEIRNPLSSIRLNLELLSDELAHPTNDNFGEAHTLLRAIQSEVDVLTRFTDESLQFARIPRLHLEPLSLADLVLELTAFISQEVAQRHCQLHLEIPPTLPNLQADPLKLKQVLLNLLRNALDAMPKGGTIRIELQQNDTHVLLSIQDQGTGIPFNLLDKIFEPFFTTKPHGTGLGLPLSKQIIWEHGGTLTCQSEPGQGTLFTISLPIQKPSSVAVPTNTS